MWHRIPWLTVYERATAATKPLKIGWRSSARLASQYFSIQLPHYHFQRLSSRSPAAAVERAAVRTSLLWQLCSMSHTAQEIISRNSNTNYSFGSDVIDNNWVINFSAPGGTVRAAQNQVRFGRTKLNDFISLISHCATGDHENNQVKSVCRGHLYHSTC